VIALQTADGNFLDLPGNARLDITGSNPAFDQDTIARVFSFPFLLPDTPRNLRQLQHANRLDAKRMPESKTTQDIRLWMAGSVFQSGFLKLGDVTDRSLECSFGNRERALLDEWDNLKIRSLMPAVTVPQVAYEAIWEYTLAPVPFLYFITINGVPLSYNATGGGTQNDAGLGLAAAINAVYPGAATYISPTNTLIVKALNYSPFVVTDTIQGLTLISARNRSEASQLNFLTYVQTVINAPVATHSFPTLRHNGLYGQTNFTFSGYVNYWHDGVQGVNVPAMTPEWQYTYVPYVKLKYVFDQIAAASGLGWQGDFYDSQDFADLRIFSNYALDTVEFDWFTDNFRYLNVGKASFSLSNYVPDLSAKDFVFRICAMLNLYPDLRGKDILLRRRRDQVAAPVRNLVENVSPTYKMKTTPQKGVRLRFKDVASEPVRGLDGQLDDYLIGAGGILQEVDVTPLYDREIFDDETESTWRMSIIQEKGSSDELGVGINPFALRLFFDRGEQVDSAALPYQMSTHQDIDMDGAPIGGLSLDWVGDNGLYAQMWKGWADLQDKPPLELSAVLPVSVARELLRWERPVIRFYHPLGETRAIIKNIQFVANMSDNETVKIKLETVKL